MKVGLMTVGAAALCLFGAVGAASAADITYTGVQQDGDITADYSFTTDGTVNQSLSNDNVLDYTIRLMNGSVTEVLTPVNSGPRMYQGFSSLYATSSALSVQSGDAFYLVSHAGNNAGYYDGAVYLLEDGSELQLASGNYLDQPSFVAEPNSVSFAVATPIVSAAPEPSTWVLMFVGIAGLGMALRKGKADTRCHPQALVAA